VIHKRLADILKHHGKRFADVRGMLHVCTLAGENAVLAAFDHKSGTVVPTARYWELENMVAKIKPVSISILASADVFAGNEIDRSQVQQFIALLTHLAMIGESGLVLVSHPSLTGISSDSGLSGSTQWHNSVRARYYIKHVKPKNGEDFDANLRVIEFKKNNYGAISESIPLRYEDGLFVSVAQSTADQVARDAGAQVVFLAQLTKLTDQGFDLGPNKKSPSNYAPAVIAAQIGAGDYRQDEFERAMHYLLDVDKIHIAKARRDGKGRKYLRPGPKPDSDAE
jgi:RecA-family ATPase